ncbi:hypothetical protein KIW84_045548 [Lathyrus oleraceus]|uniref:Uncharacterized protein n=1 Tax=Pisum sativum TaxID=3888 RepID=A0A9D4XP24_PEA|nr:hypothetical protein KIW84_045548 [Pisum sativum]
MGKKSQKSTQKSHKNVPSSWVDSSNSSAIYVFSREVNLDREFLEVSPSSDWGVLTPSENSRISSEYGDCAIPFYECTVPVLGILLPFNPVEVKVLKNLEVTLS